MRPRHSGSLPFVAQILGLDLPFVDQAGCFIEHEGGISGNRGLGGLVDVEQYLARRDLTGGECLPRSLRG
jgi:hypothetical protein